MFRSTTPTSSSFTPNTGSLLFPVKLVKPGSRPKLAALCASGASVMRLLPTPPLRARAGQESERR